jgi:hypothetical protein
MANSLVTEINSSKKKSSEREREREGDREDNKVLVKDKKSFRKLDLV